MGDLVELREVRLEGPRIRLRKARDGDAEGLIETQTDERVRRYLGGPQPVEEVRAVLESVGAATLLAAPGCYIVAAGVMRAKLRDCCCSTRPANWTTNLS